MTHNRVLALGALIVVVRSLPFGGIAPLLPLIALALMVYKPSF